MHLPAMTPRHSTTDLPGFVSRAIDTASASTTITLHTCFCTYTQGGWGSDCHGGNVGCTRNSGFAAVYPAPSFLYLGNRPPASYWLQLTSSAAVAAFLPNGGTPAPLTAANGNKVN